MKKSHAVKFAIAPALIAAGLLLTGTAAAQAATVGPVVDAPNTIAPGGTGDVGATVMNQYGTDQTGKVALYLTAPANSTFTTNQVWGTKIVQGVRQGGSSQFFTNCTLSSGNTVMSCVGTITIPAAGNGKESGVDFTSQIAVNDSAAGGTTYVADGGFNMSDSGKLDISGGRTSLQYVTPVVLDTPLINPFIGAGAFGLGGLFALAWYVRRRTRSTL